MIEADKDLIFSESVKAGKRIYYFDVKQSRNGDKYIAITESKKINEGTFENPRFVFEKHKLFLYKEDYEKFVNALKRTLDVAQDKITADEAKAAIVAEYETVEAPAAAPVAAPVQEEPAAETAPAAAASAEEEKTEKKSFLDKVKDIF
jgi:hypothetical protein